VSHWLIWLAVTLIAIGAICLIVGLREYYLWRKPLKPM
jgi:hypothetical protein